MYKTTSYFMKPKMRAKLSVKIELVKCMMYLSIYWITLDKFKSCKHSIIMEATWNGNQKKGRHGSMISKL